MIDAPLIPGVRLVVVGSRNPVKISAVRAVVGRVAHGAMVRGIEVPSGVPDQPWGDAETRAGATARAMAALREAPGADLAVGLEGGVVRDAVDGAVRTCAWAVAMNPAGETSLGGSLVIPLPPAVVTLLEAGVELGHAMDEVARTTGTKHAGGAVGLLTSGLIPLQQVYEMLATYALSRWFVHGLWEELPGPR